MMMLMMLMMMMMMMMMMMVEFAINNAQHTSTGFTPFYLNYGRHPKTPLSLQVPTTDDTPEFADYGTPAVTKFTADLQAAVHKATGMLQAAQNRQKAYADQRRSPDPDYAVGTEVLLSGKHIPLKHPGSYKLLPRWLGPFRVAKRISSVAYKLELPASMARIHPVFHASLLKPYRSDGAYRPPPPVILKDGSEEYEVTLYMLFWIGEVFGVCWFSPHYYTCWCRLFFHHNYTPLLGRLAGSASCSLWQSGVCGSVCCSTPRGCRGSTPLLFLVRVLDTSWDKGCMAASASGNSVAGLRNQIRLVGVYGQLLGLRLPL
jgi:hypothetical protein